jgi:hypothetical protein
MAKSPKAKRGRPPKIPRKELVRRFEEYIESHELPIVSEFALQVGYHRKNIYKIPEIQESIARCITKKEFALEHGALTGKYQQSMAIFSLKQLGWKDERHVDKTAKVEVTTKPPEPVAATVTPDEAQAAYLDLLRKDEPENDR